MTERLFYLLPFSWFWATRLRHGSVAFHAMFEWLAAVVVIVALAPGGVKASLFGGLMAYLAFISLYEIGYIANDLVMAPREPGGRTRGPQGASSAWIALWAASRIIAFIVITLATARGASPEWWGFFGSLAVVFAFHNLLEDRELKAGTFLWLSWLRFMAPVAFAVPAEHVLGIGLGCAMSYSAFRQLGYLDSKGLLQMPGRKRPRFRWVFFLWPLLGALAMASVPGARGLVVLTVYFAIVASLGVMGSRILGSIATRRAD